MKKFKALIFAFIFSTAFVSGNSIDLELPLKIEFAKSENELNHNYSNTSMLKFPLPFTGPARVSYVFEKPESKWSFGVGCSVYVYPFQTLSVSGSARYHIYTFENGNSLELRNILDAGLFMHFKGYYNVEKGKRDVMSSISPFVEYSPMIFYIKNNFEFGFGPDFAAACDQNFLKVFYGINFNFGYKFF